MLNCLPQISTNSVTMILIQRSGVAIQRIIKTNINEMTATTATPMIFAGQVSSNILAMYTMPVSEWCLVDPSFAMQENRSNMQEIDSVHLIQGDSEGMCGT